MITIKKYKIEEPTSISIIETIEVKIPITFSLEDKEQIITLKLYYEDRNGEKWLSYFLVNDDDSKCEYREDVEYKVFNCLEEEISQQTAIQDVCNDINKIIDEIIKKYDINEDSFI